MLQKAWRLSKRQQKSIRQVDVSPIDGRPIPALEKLFREQIAQKIGDPDKLLSENAIPDLLRDTLLNSKNAPYGKTKLFLIGEGRSGKSSLGRVLMNQRFDRNEPPSTRISVRKIDAANWLETTHDSFIYRLGKELEGKQEMTSATLLDILHSTTPDLSFMLWDFASNFVLDSMHNLFLTEYGFYLLVFDARKLLGDQRADSVQYLQRWLFSKKINAPRSPVVLVGSHCADLSQRDLVAVDDVISEQVLQSNRFQEISYESFSFFPVDSNTGLGIEKLRKTIVEVVKQQKYIYREVPVAFMRLMELVADIGQDYLHFDQIEEMAIAFDLTSRDLHKGLKFLSYRGLITYLHQNNLLRRIIILRPQWLVDGLRCIIHDLSKERPVFDRSLARDYRRFKREQIVSYELIESIWSKAGYGRQIRNFFLRVLLKSSLIGEYNFDKGHTYLVPTFSPNTNNVIVRGLGDYCGPYFVIDFSGNCDADIIQDAGDVFVRYRPFGFFERLVCLCVEHSARFPDSMQPDVGFGIAKLSFGVEVDFLVRVCDDADSNPNWIKVTCVRDTSAVAAQTLLKRVFSMIEGLKEDFFSNRRRESQLAVSLLLPSSEDTGEVLANYKSLKQEYSEKKANGSLLTIFRPSKLQNKKVALASYGYWFESDQEEQELINVSEGVQDVVYSPVMRPLKPLPQGLEYHCFLSYKQRSAIDIVGKQFLILKNNGYKCWYDQEFPGTINLVNMKEGVKRSMCYILFLSEGIFPSPYVEAELETALEHKKPIMLLHHPNTGQEGYPSFDVYIKTAPDILKPLFADIESIALQRRYYLQEAVTKLIDARLSDILRNSLA